MAPESTLDPYAEHIKTLQERLEAALAESTLEGLIIASGAGSVLSPAPGLLVHAC